MARGLHQDSSSTDITASSSEDEGCSQRKKRRTKKSIFKAYISGQDNNVAIGDGASVASTTTTAAAAGAADDKTENSFDAAEHLKNPTELLEAVAKCRGTEKDKIEKNILQEFLPYIENHANMAASSCNDALELLARFSSPDLKSPRLAMHSLKIMKRLLDQEFGNCESANAHIIEVERILRRPFVDGSFARELQHNQRRRAEVYNSVLALVLLYVAEDHLKHPYVNKTDKEEIKDSVTKNIKKSLQRNPRPRKDRWRFSMETVLNLIERLFDYKKLSHMTELLDLCKDINLKAVLKKLQGTESGLVDRFVILKKFHGKLCNNDGNAYQIVEVIIKNHDVFSKQWQHRNEDWQFALLACQILLHTINSSNLSKATRIQAAHCLGSLTEAKVYRKSPVIRYIIENHCTKTSFARDLESRKIVIERCFNQNLLEKVLRKVSINQICKTHEAKGLEYKAETLCVDDDRFIVRGLYDHQPVAITVATVNPKEKLYSAQDQDLSTSEKHLQNEIMVLQHLNQTPNKHVLMVYTAETKTRPFHMICEYMPKQDLLHFLTVCKEDQELPTYRQLLEICLEIANCMIFIHGKHVIHNQLLPQHVLLDDNCNVKITGFLNAKILSTNQIKSGIQGEKLDFDDPSIRFAAPECLEDDPLFSPESDVWAFGVLMYVVFTCGGTPYANQDTKDIHQHVLSGRTLTKDWLRDEIFSLIQKCMGKTREDRISFQKISEDLQKLLDGSDEKGWDERLKIPETMPKKEEDTHDDVSMEEENTLVLSQLMSANPVSSNIREGFGSPLKNEMKRPTSMCRGAYLVDCSKGHLKKLRSLDHPHLANIVKYKKTRFGREITYENCKGPNLRNYILCNDCAPKDVIRFAAQITEAIDYLHSKNIILCVLNAENIRIVNNNQVKIFGLHFSRSILPSFNELNISFGVAHGEIDPDMYRWCAKEVIQDGLFSPAGDIWSLGMTILEMFMCLSKDETAKPFSHYSDEEILDVLKMNFRPYQPVLCPDWVYVLVTQCWCLHTSERASSLSVLDCLTQRCPWESYVLQRWIEKNEIHENWPDLIVVQALDEASSISRQNVERSVSDEFAGYHTYEYERPFWWKKAFTNLVSKVTSFLPSLRTPQPVWSLPASGSSSHLASSSVVPSAGHSASPSGSGSASSSLSTEHNSIHSRCSTPRSSGLKDNVMTTHNNHDETHEQLEEEESVEYASVERNWNEVVYGGEADNDILPELSTRTRSSTISLPLPPIPRSKSISTPPPLPPNSPQGAATDVKQKENNREDDGGYDDIYDRPRLPVHELTRRRRPRSLSLPPPNVPQETATDVKQKEEKREDDDKYDDINDRPRTYNNQECNTLDPEPGESYQELSYTREDGYMPLVRNSSELINEHDTALPNISTYMNISGSGTPASANNEDNTKDITCCQPVFYMSI